MGSGLNPQLTFDVLTVKGKVQNIEKATEIRLNKNNDHVIIFDWASFVQRNRRENQ